MNVRDFLYLDGQRLYSLYSQVFEGVAESVVRRVLSEAAQTKDEKKAATSATIIEASDRTERVVLHDWMYSRLETKLEPIFRDPSNLSGNLTYAPLIRVEGWVEFEDYTRMNTFFDKFNDLAKAITYAATGPVLQQLREMREVAKKEKDRNTKARLNAAVDALQRQCDSATSVNLQQDPQLMKNLKLFSEFFAPDGYQVCVVSKLQDEPIAFRAVLDRDWLRTSPDFLRTLFLNSNRAQVTLVGHVTHLAASEADPEDQKKDDDEAESSLRDSMKGMFKIEKDMEDLFFESKARKEITVQPLAIYRRHEIVGA